MIHIVPEFLVKFDIVCLTSIRAATSTNAALWTMKGRERVRETLGRACIFKTWEALAKKARERDDAKKGDL